jgi:hypothetical protein
VHGGRGLRTLTERPGRLRIGDGSGPGGTSDRVADDDLGIRRGVRHDVRQEGLTSASEAGVDEDLA